MIKGSIQQEYIIIINIYTLNIRAPEYVKQIVTNQKEENDSNAIAVRDCNIALSIMDQIATQKINKDTTD